MGKRDRLERAIKDAVIEYAKEHGEDYFEITAIISISEELGTLDIDTDIHFEDY